MTTKPQIGATSGTMVNADTVFYSNTTMPYNYLLPRILPQHGGMLRRTIDGQMQWFGKGRSHWKFDILAIQSWEMALAICCSVAGSGTVTRNAGDHTELDGASTAFTTELAAGDSIIASIGTGVYEHMIVSSISNSTKLNTTSAIVNNLSGATFRYRKQNKFSGSCYVLAPLTTLSGENVYQKFNAVANFPPPQRDNDNLGRAGKRYVDLIIEFLLIAISS